MYERINVYICPECGGETVTVEHDNGHDRGVTPFLLRCRAHGVEPTKTSCPGMARSCMYRPPSGHRMPSWEWYRPSDEEARAAGPAMAEHARKGGYFLHILAEPATTKEG